MQLGRYSGILMNTECSPIHPPSLLLQCGTLSSGSLILSKITWNLRMILQNIWRGVVGIVMINISSPNIIPNVPTTQTFWQNCQTAFGYGESEIACLGARCLFINPSTARATHGMMHLKISWKWSNLLGEIWLIVVAFIEFDNCSSNIFCQIFLFLTSYIQRCQIICVLKIQKVSATPNSNILLRLFQLKQKMSNISHWNGTWLWWS